MKRIVVPVRYTGAELTHVLTCYTRHSFVELNKIAKVTRGVLHWLDAAAMEGGCNCPVLSWCFIRCKLTFGSVSEHYTECYTGVSQVGGRLTRSTQVFSDRWSREKLLP